MILLDTVTCNMNKASGPHPKTAIQNEILITTKMVLVVCFSPNVDNLSMAFPVLVVVQDDVTVSSIELPIGGGINIHLV